MRDSDRSNAATGNDSRGSGDNWFQPREKLNPPYGTPSPPLGGYQAPNSPGYASAGAYAPPGQYAPPGGYAQPPDATVADGSIQPIATYVPSPAGSAGEPVRPPRRKARLIGIIALIVVGLAAIGGGAGGLVWAHLRKPTPAQVDAAGQQEYMQQWRWLTAGQIFPAKVSYTGAAGDQANATLVGIVPQAPCAAAFDASVARVLDAAGCVTVLRATYADASDTALVTIGVVVMPSTAVADSVSGKLELDQSHGLLPVSFPGTIAGKFTPKARETVGDRDTAGRYLVFYAGGYADGRKTAADTNDEEVTFGMPSGLALSLVDTFSAPADPCADREVRCTP